ncbi:hypothetical protein CASFOL_031357 [Castilleja foliolosa]|uniref:Gnk2-homologous domain-containing protein n=1 Tax=Castilleja foliolosa TaxID=1961234 RepID=A0ABD3C528_9LAMI
MCYHNNLLILHIILTSSLLPFPIAFSIIQKYHHCSDTRGSYDAGSNYSQSLKQLVDDLRENTPNTNRYKLNASYAEDPTSRVYGRARCSSDVSKEDCSICLTKAMSRLVKTYCKDSLEAIIGLKYPGANCQFKYSDVDFLRKEKIDEDNVM